MSRSSVAVSYLRYQLIRGILGLYLLVHFGPMIFWPPELFTNTGVVADLKLLPTFTYFPSPLFTFNEPWFVYGLVGVQLLLAVLLILGKGPVSVPLLLCVGWVTLLGRNPLISTLGMLYVSWIFLAMAAVAWINSRLERGQWTFPSSIYILGLVLLAAGYSLSGIQKLGSPRWIDGQAIRLILENPLSHGGVVSKFIASMPPLLLKLQTWGILALEILGLPLLLWPKSRPWAWLLFLLFHMGIMIILDFVDLTMGMIIIHLFLFDERWIPSKKLDQGRPLFIFFDGVCHVCNHAVDFIIAAGDPSFVKVAPLQGKTAAELLPLDDLPDSIITYDGRHLLMRSDAVLCIGASLGGVWRFLSWVGALCPRKIRDWVYDFVAKNRYRIYGKKETCRLPSDEDRSFFLP